MSGRPSGVPLECKECEADDNVKEMSEMIDTRMAR